LLDGTDSARDFIRGKVFVCHCGWISEEDVGSGLRKLEACRTPGLLPALGFVPPLERNQHARNKEVDKRDMELDKTIKALFNNMRYQYPVRPCP
jgi:hypothetical protein